jgi:hypothetical protein
VGCKLGNRAVYNFLFQVVYQGNKRYFEALETKENILSPQKHDLNQRHITAY